MESLRKHWVSADQLCFFRIAKRVVEQQVCHSGPCGVDVATLHFSPILMGVDTIDMSAAYD
jgi:hypothetical protein